MVGKGQRWLAICSFSNVQFPMSNCPISIASMSQWCWWNVPVPKQSVPHVHSINTPKIRWRSSCCSIKSWHPVLHCNIGDDESSLMTNQIGIRQHCQVSLEMRNTSMVVPSWYDMMSSPIGCGVFIEIQAIINPPGCSSSALSPLVFPVQERHHYHQYIYLGHKLYRLANTNANLNTNTNMNTKGKLASSCGLQRSAAPLTPPSHNVSFTCILLIGTLVSPSWWWWYWCKNMVMVMMMRRRNWPPSTAN